MTAIPAPFLPPVTPPTIAWDVVLGIADLALGAAALYKLSQATKTQSTAKPTTTTQDCPEDPCKDKGNQVRKLLNGEKSQTGGKDFKGLKQRHQELSENKLDQDLVWQGMNRPAGMKRPPGSDVQGHIYQIDMLRKQMNKALNDYHGSYPPCKTLSPDELKEAEEYMYKDPFDSIDPKLQYKLDRVTRPPAE